MAMTRAKRVQSDTDMVTALIYCRVSSEGQRDGVSLDGQLRECRRYAAAQGMAIGAEFVDVMSGTRSDRPQYQELLATIRTATAERRRVAVLVWRLDRLGRRILERVQRREELKALGVGTHSATEGGEVSDLVANILASVAEEESRVVSERVRGAHRTIEAAGWRALARPAFGYLIREATEAERRSGAPRKVLDIDPPAAAVVRAVFQKIAAGEGIRPVARWLQQLPYDERGGRTWSANTTRRMLRAPVYIARVGPDDGDPMDVLTQPAGQWPTIITDDLWRVVHAELSLNDRLPHRHGVVHLLSGFITCPREGCTSKMGGQARRDPNDSRHAPHYRCSLEAGGERCTATVTMATVDGEVMRQVAGLLDSVRFDDELRRELRREWDRLRGSEVTVDQQRIQRFRAALEQGRRRLADAAVMLLDGVLDRDGYDAARDQIQADMTATAAELERLENVVQTPILPDLDTAMRMIGGWRAAMMAGDVESQRRVLVQLIDGIELDRIKRGKYTVTIRWSELAETLRQVAANVKAAA